MPTPRLTGLILASALASTLASSACGNSSAEPPTDRPAAPEQVWKTNGYRDTDPAARAVADKVLASLDLGLSPEWLADRPNDGTRQFARDGVVLEVYVAEAQKLVAIADEPVTSLAELLERARPGAVNDGWPFWWYRFKSVIDQGEAGDELWVRGPLQKNDQCSEHGCPDTWQDSGEVGFVVFRVIDRQRVRCSGRGIDLGAGNAALTTAFAACRSMTVAAK